MYMLENSFFCGVLNEDDSNVAHFVDKTARCSIKIVKMYHDHRLNPEKF
jgi:hypothetical protein